MKPPRTSKLPKPTKPKDLKYAEPRFRGDKERLIHLVDAAKCPASVIPTCFGDPDFESGMCNPNMPLRPGETFQCAVSKSCLVAKMITAHIAVKPTEARERSYQDILADADALFDEPSSDATDNDPATEGSDRNALRAHAVSISLSKPPPNPYRRGSMRRLVLDILGREWIALPDLKARMLSLKADIRRFDLIVGQVTSVSSQETYGYRILETFGRYKAVAR